MINNKSKLQSELFLSSFNDIKKCENKIKRSNSVISYVNPNYFRYLYNRLIGKKLLQENNESVK